MSSRTKTAITPLGVSPADAARMLGVSRSHVYDLIHANELESRRSGSRLIVSAESVRAYFDRLPRSS